MFVKSVCIGLLLVVALVTASAHVEERKLLLAAQSPQFNGLSKPSGNVTNIVEGFAWVENLWFDGQGGLFFSDFYFGELWKATRDETTGNITKQVWVSGSWKQVLGITDGLKNNTINVVVQLNDGTFAISVVDINKPQTHSVLIKTPTKGNGLAYNPTTSWLYIANEGDFIPFESKIYSVNITPGLVQLYTMEKDMSFQDGAFVDVQNQLLYTTASVDAKIYIWDISNPVEGKQSYKKSYKAPDAKTCDDLCVVNWDPSNPQIFLAEFIEGAILQFNADGSGGSRTVASGFHAVTSVREGKGPGWGPAAWNDFTKLIYVSEGGTLNEKETNRGIWEIPIL